MSHDIIKRVKRQSQRKEITIETSLNRLKAFVNLAYNLFAKKCFPYGSLKVIGPEHEFSVVDKDLKPLPIVDQIIKDMTGAFSEFVDFPKFIFGKEFSLHILEIKARKPFRSPILFEERMQDAVKTLLDLLERKYHARLLGTGMHPFLNLDDTSLWSHTNFDLTDQLWKCIQSKASWLVEYSEFSIEFTVP